MKSALKVIVGNMPVICSRGTYLSYEGYSPFGKISKSKHREGSIGTLSQTAIARLSETPEMLERQERMLSLGSHTRLFTIGLFVSIGQWTIPVRACSRFLVEGGAAISVASTMVPPESFIPLD